MAAGVKAHKRARSESDECVFSHRSKCFINQQIIDQNDANKMKKIHDKTIKMLFKNANSKAKNITEEPMDQFRNRICLMGNGHINYAVNADTKFASAKIDPQRKCNLCLRMSNIQAIGCTNCHLELCEFCGVSCIQCNEPLCMTCVNVFGCCDNASNACCESCKLMNNI